MKPLPVICAVALLTGCVSNPYAQFYQSYTNRMPVEVQQRLIVAPPQPQILTATPQTHSDEGRRLEERGFVCVGFSGFRGGAPTQQQLVEHAKKVGAEVVIHSSEYSHTEQGVRPVFSYEPGQTLTTTHYGTAKANVYGSGGYAYGSGTYSGYSTSTTPGTLHTDYVPYQHRVYEYGATFWRRIKPGVFGVLIVPIPESMRGMLQRNTGAFVEVVMQDSPAFKANIMRGDIIIQMADKPITSVQEFIELVPSYAGQKVSVRVIRGTQTRNIEVQLRESQ
jgi:serine protease Do